MEMVQRGRGVRAEERLIVGWGTVEPERLIRRYDHLAGRRSSWREITHMYIIPVPVIIALV